MSENINCFLNISKNSIILQKMEKLINNYKNFLNSNELSFKILLLGKYNSGKSSLLNSIIGYNLNILDIAGNECTKKAFVIKYCKSFEEISLFSAEVIKNDFGFYYFKEVEKKGVELMNVKEL